MEKQMHDEGYNICMASPLGRVQLAVCSISYNIGSDLFYPLPASILGSLILRNAPSVDLASIF
jgi:hypothetical protein